MTLNGDSATVEDVLGAPYTAETLVLAPDFEGEVVATLVRRTVHDDGAPAAAGAVLHLHGFADYFFHTELADFWVARGYDVYALDLRKYGRSLHHHQSPNFVADLATYDEELAAAWQRITERDGHTRVVVSAHSTGGLVAPLWLDRVRPPRAGRRVPELPVAGGDRLAPLPPRAHHAHRRGGRPATADPRAPLGAGHLHPQPAPEPDGEFDFDLAWKPRLSMPVYAGWLRAVRRGQAVLHRGLDLPTPVLVMTSDRSGWPSQWDEAVHEMDIVLDVGLLHRWAPVLGAHVTSRRIAGAKHDVVLSRQPARAAVYDALDRWLRAYVEVDG